MTPIEYCYDVLVKSRDPLYFCIKKVPAQQRESILGIKAFYLTLEKIILESSDNTIAIQQLVWWRHQILTIQPQHPIAILLNAQNISKEILIEIVDGFIGLTNDSFFEKFEDIVIFIMQTAGKREKLMIDLLAPKNSISLETIYELTLALELTHYIQHLRGFVRRGVLLFSEEELQQFGASRDLFAAYHTTSEIQGLLQYQAQKIERIYAKTFPLKSIFELKVLIAQIEIANGLMKEIRLSGFTVLENYIQLTPLKMWWVGYRN